MARGAGDHGNRPEHRLANPQRAPRRRRADSDLDAARRRVDGARHLGDQTDAERLAPAPWPALSVTRIPDRTRAASVGVTPSTTSTASGSEISTSDCDGSTEAPSEVDSRVTTPVIGERIVASCSARRAAMASARAFAASAFAASTSLRGAIPESASRCCRASASSAVANTASALCRAASNDCCSNSISGSPRLDRLADRDIDLGHAP